MNHVNLDFYLRSQLEQFGLNPEEWEIERQGPRHYAIQNRADAETYFLGLIKKEDEPIGWQEIQVAL